MCLVRGRVGRRRVDRRQVVVASKDQFEQGVNSLLFGSEVNSPFGPKWAYVLFLGWKSTHCLGRKSTHCLVRGGEKG